MDPNLQSGVIDTTMPTTTNKQRLLTQIFAHLPIQSGGPFAPSLTLGATAHDSQPGTMHVRQGVSPSPPGWLCHWIGGADAFVCDPLLADGGVCPTGVS